MSTKEQLEECVVIMSEQLTWALQYLDDKVSLKKVKPEIVGAVEELTKMRKLLRELE